MKKTILLGGLSGMLLLSGGLYYQRHRVHLTPEQGAINARWQRDFRPKADHFIERFNAKGLDTRRAIKLCDRIVPTIEAGGECIDELERLENALEMRSLPTPAPKSSLESLPQN